MGLGAFARDRKLALGGLPTLWPFSDFGSSVGQSPDGLPGAERAVNALACLTPLRTSRLRHEAIAPVSRLFLGGWPTLWPSSDLGMGAGN